MTASDESAGRPQPPLLRIVKGDPTDEEIAALVAVVAARAATVVDEPEARMSAWADPAASLRRPLQVGPGAWVASGRAPGTRTRADW